MKLSKRIKPKILLIGAGNFGKNHARVWLSFLKNKKISWLGIVDTNPKTREYFKRTFGVSVYEKITPDLLQTVDAVDIVTPASTHVKIIKQCLPSVHVLVEKPLALTTEEANDLNQLAIRQKHLLMVGHIYRFHPLLPQLKKIITQARTPLYHISAQFGDFVSNPTAECGILLSDLHAFDILDAILGQAPQSVFAETKFIRPHRKYEDEASVMLHYHNNLTASVRLSWQQNPKTRIIKLFFADKTITVDWQKNQILTESDKKIKKYQAHPPLTALEIELNAFVKALHQNISPVDGKTAARIIKIATLAAASVKKQTKVLIKGL